MDFKTAYFDSLRLRNELMSRLSIYLSLPKRLDDLAFMNKALLKSTKADVQATAAQLQVRITEYRKEVEVKIVATQKLTTDIMLLKDTIEATPELKSLLTGDTGLVTFAIQALKDRKLMSYKPLADQTIKYSKDSLAMIKDLERLDKEITALASLINETYKASLSLGAVPSLESLRKAEGYDIMNVPPVVWAIGAVLALAGGTTAIKFLRRKN